jgi:hypothetical protein
MTDNGFAIEVTPAGEVVWDFRSPHRVQDGELVARLFEVERLPEGFAGFHETDGQARVP